jgi:hypothetical protein
MRLLSILIMGGALLGGPPARAQYPPAYGQPGYGPPANPAYPENPATLIRSWYRQFLNRDADPSGLTTWTNTLRSGSSPDFTLAQIVGSDEYYAKAGSTPEGFVRTVFLDLTGRAPTYDEMPYWLRRLTFEDRRDVAYALLQRYPQSWRTPPAYYPGTNGYYRRPPR